MTDAHPRGELRIALAGNPNSGKTTLFNALTGAHYKVGNYPGVTVEKREGIRLRDGRAYRFIDLPGIYSLTAYSIDQKVKLLGVNRAAAKRVNGVSAAVATQMARGAAELFGSDLAVATTGYAEPAAAQGVTDPFAYWAIAHRVSPRRWQVLTGQVVCPGQKRTEVQATVAEIVLAELVDYLKTIAP